VLTGTYTYAYCSGGPPGTTFIGITPASTQVLGGQETKTFTFNFATGDIKIKHVGPDLSTSSAPPGIQAWYDSAAPSAGNPANFINIATGDHIVHARDLADFAEDAASCGYTRGSAECAVGAGDFNAVSCFGGMCPLPISVDQNRVTKVVYRYAQIPALTFSADQTIVVSGASTTLRWTVNNATSCTAGGDWSGSVASSDGSHAQTTGNLTSQKTYTLFCSNANGDSPTRTVTIIVRPGPIFREIRPR